MCGTPTVNVALLKQICTYKDGVSADQDHVKYMWEALERFDNELRSQFLFFIW